MPIHLHFPKKSNQKQENRFKVTIIVAPVFRFTSGLQEDAQKMTLFSKNPKWFSFVILLFFFQSRKTLLAF